MVLLTLLCLFYLITASLLIHGARKVISLTLRNFNCRLHNDNGSIVLLTLTKTLHQGKAGLLVPWMVVTFLSLVYDLVAGLIKITDITIIIIITSGIIFIVLSIRSKSSPLWFVSRHLELFLGSLVSASAVISLLLSGRSGLYPCELGNFLQLWSINIFRKQLLEVNLENQKA